MPIFAAPTLSDEIVAPVSEAATAAAAVAAVARSHNKPLPLECCPRSRQSQSSHCGSHHSDSCSHTSRSWPPEPPAPPMQTQDPNVSMMLAEAELQETSSACSFARISRSTNRSQLSASLPPSSSASLSAAPATSVALVQAASVADPADPLAFVLAPTPTLTSSQPARVSSRLVFAAPASDTAGAYRSQQTVDAHAPALPDDAAGAAAKRANLAAAIRAARTSSTVSNVSLVPYSSTRGPVATNAPVVDTPASVADGPAASWSRLAPATRGTSFVSSSNVATAPAPGTPALVAFEAPESPRSPSSRALSVSSTDRAVELLEAITRDGASLAASETDWLRCPECMPLPGDTICIAIDKREDDASLGPKPMLHLADSGCEALRCSWRHAHSPLHEEYTERLFDKFLSWIEGTHLPELRRFTSALSFWAVVRDGLLNEVARAAMQKGSMVMDVHVNRSSWRGHSVSAAEQGGAAPTPATALATSLTVLVSSHAQLLDVLVAFESIPGIYCVRRTTVSSRTGVRIGPPRKTSLECGSTGARGKMKVLVADDSSLNRRLLSRAFKKHFDPPFDVIEVETAADALTEAATHCFDLIVMDEIFSADPTAMRGSQAIAELRRRGIQNPRPPGVRRLVVISCTGNAKLSEQKRALVAAGADTVWGKPFPDFIDGTMQSEVMRLVRAAEGMAASTSDGASGCAPNPRPAAKAIEAPSARAAAYGIWLDITRHNGGVRVRIVEGPHAPPAPQEG